MEQSSPKPKPTLEELAEKFEQIDCQRNEWVESTYEAIAKYVLEELLGK